MSRLLVGSITIAIAAIACGNVIGIDQEAKLSPDAGAAAANASEPPFADDTDNSICDVPSCKSVGGICRKWGCDIDCADGTSCAKPIVCPPGNDCNITCTGANCNNVTCTSEERACRYDCTSGDCTATTCTATSCEFYCQGDSSCKGGAGCTGSQTTECKVECSNRTANDACSTGIAQPPKQ